MKSQSSLIVATMVLCVIVSVAFYAIRAPATANTPAAVRVLGRTDSGELTVWRVQMQEGGNCYVFSVRASQPYVWCQ